MFEIKIKSFFCASHKLQGYHGDCSGLHGHNWEVHAVLMAEGLNEIGLSADFRKVKDELNEVLSELDHTHLNDHEAFCDMRNNPTTENIAKYIYGQLSKKIKIPGLRCEKIIVCESRDCSAAYFEPGA